MEIALSYKLMSEIPPIGSAYIGFQIDTKFMVLLERRSLVQF